MTVPSDVRQFVEQQRLTDPRPLQTVLRTASLVAVFGVSIGVGLVVDRPLVWIVCWLSASLALFGCAGGLHEAGHGNAFNRPWANHALGVALGLPLLLPYAMYRCFHLEHHRSTHGPEDTEPAERYRRPLEYVLIVPMIGLGLVAYLVKDAVLTLVGRPPRYVRTPSQRRLAVLNLAVWTAWTALLAFALVQQPRLVIVGWLVPYLLTASFWVPLVLTPEHYECAWGPDSPFRTTRTTVSNAILRYFYWGTNWHTAHHLVPSVPGYQLPRLHALIEDRCEHVERSYLRWHLGLLRRLRAQDLPTEAPWLAPDPAERHSVGGG